MGRRIIAIGLIWGCTALAWFALSATVEQRTRDKGSSNRSSVGTLWGKQHLQKAPSLSGPKNSKLALDSSAIEVDLDLTHRKKGLQWFPTYGVRFEGSYTARNPSAAPLEAILSFALPDRQAVYDDFQLTVDGEAMESISLSEGVVQQPVTLLPGAELKFSLAYTSQGMAKWFYAFGSDARQVRNFSLQMNTNFAAIDFPETGSSPTEKVPTRDGWRLTWRYDNLLSGVQIGMVMPERLNPGPWVEMVSASAPISLFLFFFLLFITSTLTGMKVHPMNYFFIAAAFFSYHLLLSYLVDHMSIHLAFWIASAVSILLVVSYMRLVVGGRAAFLQVGVSQFVYLVLFSYTFFFEGFTGLAITILCIATLFIVMQVTGRMDWEELFNPGTKPPGTGTPGTGTPETGAAPPEDDAGGASAPAPEVG